MALTGDARKANKSRTVEPQPPIGTKHLSRLMTSGGSVTEKQIREAELLDRAEAARVFYDDSLICRHPFVTKNCCDYCFAHVTDKQIQDMISEALTR